MQTITIAGGRLRARLIPFGATLVDLYLEGWQHSLVLGFERLEDYARTNHYAGAVIGRHANRIFRGEVVLDGKAVQLPANGDGNHLHGGETGLARQTWTILGQTERALRLECISPDGHEDYPGTCRFVATYEIVDDATLRLTLEAVTDRTTLVNLCQHPYFNFSGRTDIFDHVLEVDAERYLPSDADLIPTGEQKSVTGTPFDFSAPRSIGANRPSPGYNNNFCLADRTRTEPQFAARLTAPGGPMMELWTTQTGLHVYDGYKLADGQLGSEGRVFGPNAGICLEAQNWPDSPRNSNFPSAVLSPDQTYYQVTEYRF